MGKIGIQCRKECSFASPGGKIEIQSIIESIE
jgi:hypothetical protein